MQYSSDIKKSESQQFISINNCGELRVNSDSHIQQFRNAGLKVGGTGFVAYAPEAE